MNKKFFIQIFLILIIVVGLSTFGLTVGDYTPDKIKKPMQGIWDALLDLQQQIDSFFDVFVQIETYDEEMAALEIRITELEERLDNCGTSNFQYEAGSFMSLGTLFPYSVSLSEFAEGDDIVIVASGYNGGSSYPMSIVVDSYWTGTNIELSFMAYDHVGQPVNGLVPIYINWIATINTIE